MGRNTGGGSGGVKSNGISPRTYVWADSRSTVSRVGPFRVSISVWSEPRLETLSSCGGPAAFDVNWSAGDTHSQRPPLGWHLRVEVSQTATQGLETQPGEDRGHLGRLACLEFQRLCLCNRIVHAPLSLCFGNARLRSNQLGDVRAIGSWDISRYASPGHNAVRSRPQSQGDGY